MSTVDATGVTQKLPVPVTAAAAVVARRRHRCRWRIHIHRRRTMTLWSVDYDGVDQLNTRLVYTDRADAAAAAALTGGQVVLVAHRWPIRVCGLARTTATAATIGAAAALVAGRWHLDSRTGQ